MQQQCYNMHATGMPWHGTDPWTGRFMARHGPENLGTARPEKYWHGKNMARHGTKNLAIKLFLLGGCRPPDPLLFLGGFQPTRPPVGGPAAPCARLLNCLRGSASQALHFLGTKVLVP